MLIYLSIYLSSMSISSISIYISLSIYLSIYPIFPAISHYMMLMLDFRAPRAAPRAPFIIFSHISWPGPGSVKQPGVTHASWSSWFMIANYHAVFSALKPLASVPQHCSSLIAFWIHTPELEEHNPACQHSLQCVAAQPMSQNCS